MLSKLLVFIRQGQRSSNRRLEIIRPRATAQESGEKAPLPWGWGGWGDSGRVGRQPLPSAGPELGESGLLWRWGCVHSQDLPEARPAGCPSRASPGVWLWKGLGRPSRPSDQVRRLRLNESLVSPMATQPFWHGMGVLAPPSPSGISPSCCPGCLSLGCHLAWLVCVVPSLGPLWGKC